jgi:hypothetical protein
MNNDAIEAQTSGGQMGLGFALLIVFLTILFPPT